MIAASAPTFCATITFDKLTAADNLFGVNVTFPKSTPLFVTAPFSAAHDAVDAPVIGITVSAAMFPKSFNPTLE